ncbi:MAG: hypothetical protein JWN37_830 [Candidatus Nomurabacteria bacterium]|nr:hypothetical protein [Candidatus Nomurabacteria bacterium]
MNYESEIGELLSNPDKNSMELAIRRLNGKGNSYGSLTKANGDYLQVGGGIKEFTVEFRKIHKNGFKHFKATKTEENLESHIIKIGGSKVTVREDQVLDLQMTCQIFFAFIEGEPDVEGIKWVDMTSMFE